MRDLENTRIKSSDEQRYGAGTPSRLAEAERQLAAFHQAVLSLHGPEEAQKAIAAMNGQPLDGRPLTVNIARPKEERAPGGPGGRDRGPRRDFGGGGSGGSGGSGGGGGYSGGGSGGGGGYSGGGSGGGYRRPRY